MVKSPLWCIEITNFAPKSRQRCGEDHHQAARGESLWPGAACRGDVTWTWEILWHASIRFHRGLTMLKPMGITIIFQQFSQLNSTSDFLPPIFLVGSEHLQGMTSLIWCLRVCEQTRPGLGWWSVGICALWATMGRMAESRNLWSMFMIWRFPEMGVPPNHPWLDYFSIQTRLGSPILRTPTYFVLLGICMDYSDTGWYPPVISWFIAPINPH